MTDASLTRIVFWLALAVFVVLFFGGILSLFVGDYVGATFSLLVVLGASAVMFYTGGKR